MDKFYKKLYDNRFEFLLFALIMTLFNKIFFVDDNVYIRIIWPINNVLLGISSLAIFKNQKQFLKVIKNILFVVCTIFPFAPGYFLGNKTLALVGLLSYIFFYLLIFVEVLRQITSRTPIHLNTIFGALSGYLILMFLALYSFLLCDYFLPLSFNNANNSSIPLLYNDLSYFSITTLTTVGYGDITPSNPSSRLLSNFFAILGQIYLVTLVGIIISKFTSNTKTTKE